MSTPVVVQMWEESERGWGVRPDGYSLHPNNGALTQYVKDYWDGLPDKAPDEYSRPCGSPFIKDIEDEAVLKKLADDGFVRVWQGQP